MSYKEFESLEELMETLKSKKTLEKAALQNLDLTKIEKEVLSTNFTDSIFLGCTLNESIRKHIEDGNYIFPKLEVPFNVYPEKLYNKDTLLNNYKIGHPESAKDSYDIAVYNHYIKEGKEPGSIKESLARRLHDHSITDALYDFLGKYDEKKQVAIMGGHGLSREDNNYRTVATISKKLTELGYLLISGGGPGAMEATHLGAWFAGREMEDLEDALTILGEAPGYQDELWLDTAFRVIEKYPNPKYESLGVPTWLYGHEAPTPFATQIAKYFANSVREDGLLAIAKGGVIYAPGAAGTVQEIFQDATQNHYLNFEYASPMVFLDKDYWTNKMPIYPLLKDLLEKGRYKNLILSIYDNAEDIVKELEAF